MLKKTHIMDSHKSCLSNVIANGTFIREFEIDVVNATLSLHQTIEGDVNCVVWDAAIVLSKYLEELYKKQNTYFKGLNVVELGAGVGCVGLTAACLGANVILTDLPEALPLLQLNIDENRKTLSNFGSNVVASPLIWGDQNDLKVIPDKIVLADCVYYQESIVPLVNTLKKLVSNENEILLAQEMRESETQQTNWQMFLEHLKLYFKIENISLLEQNKEFRSPDIELLRLTKS